MALSNHEQELLNELEKQLSGDTKFSASLPAASAHDNHYYLKLIGGVLLAVAGIALLLVGVIAKNPFVGVGGFLLMYVGVLLPSAKFIANFERRSEEKSSKKANRPHFKV